MKIVMHEKERCSLEAFADKHGLTMEIHERTPMDMGSRWTPNCRYYASFEDCEVKDGSVLCGAFGDGATPDEAMAEYAARISGQRLVFNAMSRERREITAPLLTHKTPNLKWTA